MKLVHLLPPGMLSGAFCIGDIMATCRWRSDNTFTSFYLRDSVEMEAWLFGAKELPYSCFQPGVYDGFFVQWL